MQAIQLDAAASVSRIGGRALHPALRDSALSTRLEMVQALDADEFSASKNNPATASALQKARQMSAALMQLPGSFVPLEEQVVYSPCLLSACLDDKVPQVMSASDAVTTEHSRLLPYCSSFYVMIKNLQEQPV